MLLEDLKFPINLRCKDIYNGPNITPIERLGIMDSSKFEELTEVWLLSKVKLQYSSVKRNAGPGDKGRDIVAYYPNLKDIDIYQCKHYKDSLGWSDIRMEFLKLCYYTFLGDYCIPKKYFIVTSKGCSTKLRTNYLDNPFNINNDLKKYLKENNIIINRKNLSKLNGFYKHVENFDFKIVQEVTPATLIEEFWESKYRPYYFGGGLKKFDKKNVEVPKVVKEEENEYISQLLQVYSEQENKQYNSHLNLDKKYIKHFEMQRTYYYSIESFRRCVRDNLPSLELFEEIEETIHQGISDIVYNPTLNGFSRLSDSLSRSVEMNMDNCMLKTDLCPNDKKGVCHRLANNKIVRWIDNE